MAISFPEQRRDRPYQRNIRATVRTNGVTDASAEVPLAAPAALTGRSGEGDPVVEAPHDTFEEDARWTSIA